MSLSGVVAKWLPQHGYGFITGIDGIEVFCHSGSIVGGKRLRVGDTVAYNIGPEPTGKKAGGKRPAVDVQGPGVIPTTQGMLVGTVNEWNRAKGYGFIQGLDGTKLYCHTSAFAGVRLEPNEQVAYDSEDIGHSSGRPVAVNVSGPAVRQKGAVTLKVKNWKFGKGYGFAEDPSGTEIFIHSSSIGAGNWLMEGKEVHCDIETKPDGKVQGVNVSGPGVRENEQQQQQLLSTHQAGAAAAQQQWTTGGGRVAGGGKAQLADLEERRQDTDGNWYTKTDFIMQYGGTAEWDARNPAFQQQVVLVPQQFVPQTAAFSPYAMAGMVAKGGKGKGAKGSKGTKGAKGAKGGKKGKKAAVQIW